MAYIEKESHSQMRERWYNHAQERAMERYGLVYTKNLQYIVKQDVKNNVYNKLLSVPGSTRVIYKGRMLDTIVTFMYCSHHNVIITFLHNNWVASDSEEFFILSGSYTTEKQVQKYNRKNKTRFGDNVTPVNSKQRRKLRSPRRKDY